MKILKSEYILKWDKLLKISEMPVIKQTYIFVILIPLFSTVINTTNDLTNEITQILVVLKNININISLPFNKFLLYISSIFFLIGRFITYWKISDFFIELPTYKRFQDLKLESKDLKKYNKEINYTNDKSRKYIYDIFYDELNKEKEISRAVITIFFGVGGLCWLYLLAEGGYKVLTSM